MNYDAERDAIAEREELEALARAVEAQRREHTQGTDHKPTPFERSFLRRLSDAELETTHANTALMGPLGKPGEEARSRRLAIIEAEKGRRGYALKAHHAANVQPSLFTKEKTQ